MAAVPLLTPNSLMVLPANGSRFSEALPVDIVCHSLDPESHSPSFRNEFSSVTPTTTRLCALQEQTSCQESLFSL